MNPRLAPLLLAASLSAAGPSFGADARSITPEQLQQYLRQYPEADANRDGVLTLEEARAYLQKRRGGKAAKALYEKMSNAMPYDEPGTLPKETYVIIMAHILKLNGVPAGAGPLVIDPPGTIPKK